MIQLADLAGREHQLAGTLSGGYRQRLALACALVHAPRLIFLDEPTAGVDPVSRRNFWGLIRRLADEGTTILVTTHYMDEAELCDTLGFIYQGKLIAQGSPASIKTDHLPPAGHRGGDRRAAPRRRRAGRLGRDRGGAAGRRAAAPGGGRSRPDAQRRRATFLRARGLDVRWVQEVEPSVEDLFVSFVDKQRKARLREQLRALALSPPGRGQGEG